MKSGGSVSSFFIYFSDLRLDAAGAGEAPAAQRFIDGEQPRRHQNQSQPQRVVHGDDAGDEAERADDAARDASSAGIITVDFVLWLGLVLVAAGLFAIFESIRGWCLVRACGIKTKI